MVDRLARDDRITDFFTGPLEGMLRAGLVPVVYGDVAIDAAKGCCVLSTEEILYHLAVALRWRRVIMAGKTDGVFTADPNLDDKARHISRIDPEGFESIKGHLTASDGIDVTGGMLLKVGRAVEMARAGIETQIVNGTRPDQRRWSFSPLRPQPASGWAARTQWHPCRYLPHFVRASAKSLTALSLATFIQHLSYLGHSQAPILYPGGRVTRALARSSYRAYKAVHLAGGVSGSHGGQTQPKPGQRPYLGPVPAIRTEGGSRCPEDGAGRPGRKSRPVCGGRRGKMRSKTRKRLQAAGCSGAWGGLPRWRKPGEKKKDKFTTSGCSVMETLSREC